MQKKLRITAVGISCLIAFLTAIMLIIIAVQFPGDYERLVILIIFSICIASTAWFLSIELIVGLEFDRFMKSLENFERTKVFLASNESFSPELQQAHQLIEKIVAQITAESKALQEKKLLESARYHFIEIISHRLRTPLSGLSWALEALGEKRYSDPTAAKDYLVLAQNSVKRIHRLLEEFIHTAEVESGTSSTKKALPVPQLIRDAIEESEALAKSKNIALVFEAPKENLPTVYGDELQLTSAIQNIISNAIYYSPENTDVVISATEKNASIEIAVRDHGMGISATDQPLIFQPLWRGQNARTRNTEGTGIGLYLTKEIMSNHEGSVTFESDEKTGSTFRLILPASQEVQLEHYIAR